MPTIEAARLCDKAPVDGILVSPTTKLLAGRVDGARFESVGELELKGIPGPMEAFTVVWEALDPERSGDGLRRWPLPEALRRAPRVAYVGRVAERRLLERSRNAARSGTRQVALLSGEPGIGKTRLASYAALGASVDGFAVCWGACSEDLAAPYEPWIDVCSQLVDHVEADVLAEYVGRFGGEIARLAGNVRRRLPDAPAPQSLILRPSGFCCSGPWQSCCGWWPGRHRCVWCSMTCSGRTANQYRCSSMRRRRLSKDP